MRLQRILTDYLQLQLQGWRAWDVPDDNFARSGKEFVEKGSRYFRCTTNLMMTSYEMEMP